jgi:hypothetical protein
MAKKTKLNKQQKEAKSLDFGSTLRKAQSGDALAIQQLNDMTANDIDYNRDYGNLSTKDLQWLYNNVPNLKDITDQAFSDYAIRNNITKDEAMNVDITDAMKSASAENRVQQADTASKNDDKWNPMSTPGSGNKKQVAQGNLTEDRPLTKAEERRVYDSSITDDESKDVDTLQKATEEVKTGITAKKPANTSNSVGGGQTTSTTTEEVSTEIPETESSDSNTDFSLGGNNLNTDDRLKKNVNDKGFMGKLINKYVFGNSIGSVNEHQKSEEQIAKAQEEVDKLQAEYDAAKERGADEKELSQIESKLNKAQDKYSRMQADYEKARAKASKNEKDALYSEFLKSNPNMVKAIFGANSGYNMGQRMAMLGELLAKASSSAGRALTSSAYGQQYVNTENPQSAKLFAKAKEEAMNRKQEEFAETQAVEIEQKKRKERISQSPTLDAVLSDENKDLMAASMAAGESLSEFEARERFWPDASDKEASQLYAAYKTVLGSDEKSADMRAKNLSNAMANLNYENQKIVNSIQNKKEAMAVVKDIDDIINNLEQQKISNYDISQEKYFDYVNGYLNYRKGVVMNNTSSGASSNSSESKNSNFNASVSGGAKVYVANVNASAGGSWGSASTSGTSAFSNNGQAVDILAKEGIPTAEKKAADWNAERKTYVDNYNKAINEQIDYWKEMRSATVAQMETLSDRSTEINDGIVKADGQQQWLVKEDGTTVKLNPNDNIYATTKEIVSDKDNGEDVVKLSSSDSIQVLNKLNYDGVKPIRKDVDYYIAKLKGEI